MVKNREINGTEEFGLVTPTPDGLVTEAITPSPPFNYGQQFSFKFITICKYHGSGCTSAEGLFEGHCFHLMWF